MKKTRKLRKFRRSYRADRIRELLADPDKLTNTQIACVIREEFDLGNTIPSLARQVSVLRCRMKKRPLLNGCASRSPEIVKSSRKSRSNIVHFPHFCFECGFNFGKHIENTGNSTLIRYCPNCGTNQEDIVTALNTK